MPSAEYYAKHRERYISQRRDYYVANSEKEKARDALPENRIRRMMGWRLRQYGIDDASYQNMLEVQNGSCAICNELMSPPHIDHDHATGRVRGLLCGNCNKAIGLFKDNPTLLNNASRYLTISANASGVFTLA